MANKKSVNLEKIGVVTYTIVDENLQRYFNELRKAEQVDVMPLLPLAKAGNRKAIDTIVKSNLRLVVAIAKRYTFLSNLELADLINEGNIGLIKSISSYDTNSAASFTTFALVCVRQHIMRAIYNYGQAVRYPEHTHTKDIEYFCESADAPISEQNGDIYTLMDTFRSELDAADRTDELDAQTIITNLLAKVKKPTERAIICKLYGIGSREHSVREIAEQYGYSTEAVRLIKVRVLAEMKKLAERMNF